ncbi:hypothetical protein O3M35_005200 [Rhynocoris fuscipes]|uniref:Uncharacterized protein n=1 Tax=Rhynocoris fuscipes TaxID=488301 RepID=A0AAW1DPX4_9HEMI
MNFLLIVNIVALFLVHQSNAMCSSDHVGECDDVIFDHGGKASAGDLFPSFKLLLISIIIVFYSIFNK